MVMSKVTVAEDGSTVCSVGWSLCNRKLDSFRKSEARRLAHERLAKIEKAQCSMLDVLEHYATMEVGGQVPHSIIKGCMEEIEYHAWLEERQKNYPIFR